MSPLDRLRSALSAHASSSPTRPFVLLTWAQSVDGYISAAAGAQTHISCAESSVLTHSLRSACDAILVGRGTVAADNPRLNTRLPGKQSSGRPVAVVLDTTASTTPDANIVQCRVEDGVPVYVFCTEAAAAAGSERKEGEIEQGRAPGIFNLLGVPTKPSLVAGEGRETLCLSSVLGALRDRSVSSVMVEGGSQVLNSFLDDALCDFIIVTIAPLLLGGGVKGIDAISTGPFRLKEAAWDVVGVDTVLSGKVDWRGRAD